jgi:hypothetical protein
MRGALGGEWITERGPASCHVEARLGIGHLARATRLPFVVRHASEDTNISFSRKHDLIYNGKAVVLMNV